MQGHREATEPAEKLALDIIHLPLRKGFKYALTGIDVYSRYGFMVPLTEIDTAHVLEGLRTRMLVGGMGKPGMFLLDGGLEFKDKIRQAIQAWSSKHRVHAPHHHESAGTIEIFNKSIGLMKHGTDLSWLDVYMDAIDVYNAKPQESLSDGSTAIFSPAEIFLGRKLKFEWETSELQANQEKIKPSALGKALQAQAEKVKEFITASREDYFKKMENTEKSARHKYRTFKVGDEVTKFKPTGSKRLDKVSPLQEGPYEIVEEGQSGADYKIHRTGTDKQPEWVHVDFIKKLERGKEEEPEEEEVEIAPAKPHSKSWALKRIVGEKGTTRRAKQWRVWWEDGTITWEPGKNLKHADDAVKAWTLLSPHEQEAITDMTAEELQTAASEAEESAATAIDATVVSTFYFSYHMKPNKPKARIAKHIHSISDEQY